MIPCPRTFIFHVLDTTSSPLPLSFPLPPSLSPSVCHACSYFFFPILFISIIRLDIRRFSERFCKPSDTFLSVSHDAFGGRQRKGGSTSRRRRTTHGKRRQDCGLVGSSPRLLTYRGHHGDGVDAARCIGGAFFKRSSCGRCFCSFIVSIFNSSTRNKHAREGS